MAAPAALQTVEDVRKCLTNDGKTLRCAPGGLRSRGIAAVGTQPWQAARIGGVGRGRIPYKKLGPEGAKVVAVALKGMDTLEDLVYVGARAVGRPPTAGTVPDAGAAPQAVLCTPFPASTATTWATTARPRSPPRSGSAPTSALSSTAVACTPRPAAPLPHARGGALVAHARVTQLWSQQDRAGGRPRRRRRPAPVPLAAHCLVHTRGLLRPARAARAMCSQARWRFDGDALAACAPT